MSQTLIRSISTSAIITALFVTLAGIVLFGSVSQAHAPQTTMQSRGVSSGIELAASLKTPTRRVDKKCNGQTTTQCCQGIAFCGCLYMPGSSDANHPTACFSSPPPSSRGG